MFPYTLTKSYHANCFRCDFLHHYKYTGPDHLAALLPSSVGSKGVTGLRIGAVWGLGHSISASILGVSSYFLKNRLSDYVSLAGKLSNLMEAVIGFSLIAIGLIGVKENTASSSSLKNQFSATSHDESGGATRQAALIDVVAAAPDSQGAVRAIFFNGLLHGFSLDGMSALLPALTMKSWTAVASFLVASAFGTISTMSIFAYSIGELSHRLNGASKSRNVPRLLSLSSSVLAIVIGVYWVVTSLLARL